MCGVGNRQAGTYVWGWGSEQQGLDSTVGRDVWHWVMEKRRGMGSQESAALVSVGLGGAGMAGLCGCGQQGWMGRSKELARQRDVGPG